MSLQSIHTMMINSNTRYQLDSIARANMETIWPPPSLLNSSNTLSVLRHPV